MSGLGGVARIRQNQDLRDWRDFAFARLARFAVSENPNKTNGGDERSPPADAPDES